MDRQPQVVGLTADHQIQRIDCRPENRPILVTGKWISLDEGILAITS